MGRFKFHSASYIIDFVVGDQCGVGKFDLRSAS